MNIYIVLVSHICVCGKNSLISGTINSHCFPLLPLRVRRLKKRAAFYPFQGIHPPDHGRSWAADSSLCPTVAAGLYSLHSDLHHLLSSSSFETTSSAANWKWCKKLTVNSKQLLLAMRWAVLLGPATRGFDLFFLQEKILFHMLMNQIIEKRTEGLYCQSLEIAALRNECRVTNGS